MKKQIFIFISICLIIIVGLSAYYYIKKPVAKVDNKIVPNQPVAAQPLNVKDISDCDKLAGEADKKICRQSYVIKETAQSGDLNKCQEAASAAMITDCQAQASFSLAIQKKDKKYCENIINKTDRESCLKVLVGMGIK